MSFRWQWWRVTHHKIFEPKAADSKYFWARAFFAGWLHYGKAWRWECEKRDTVFAGSFWVKKNEPVTVDYPPEFLR